MRQLCCDAREPGGYGAAKESEVRVPYVLPAEDSAEFAPESIPPLGPCASPPDLDVAGVGAADAMVRALILVLLFEQPILVSVGQCLEDAAVVIVGEDVSDEDVCVRDVGYLGDAKPFERVRQRVSGGDAPASMITRRLRG